MTDLWRESATTVQEVAAGATLLRQGERPDHVYLIAAGVVSLHSCFRGQRVLLGFRSRGTVLASLAAVLQTRQPAHVEALNDCIIHRIPIKTFHRLRSGDAGCGLYLQAMHARETADQWRRLEHWVTSSCAERLDQLLVELMALAGEEKVDRSIKLALTVEVEKLGLLAAVRRETASRHVWRRIKAGTLVKSKGWFLAPNTSDLIPRIHAERERLQREIDRAIPSSTTQVA